MISKMAYYWLEYLDLVFFYKCKSGIIQLNLENYVKYCNSKSRRGSSGLYLTTAYFRTELHFKGIRFLLDFPIFGMLFLVISKQKLLCLLLKLSLSLSIL